MTGNARYRYDNRMWFRLARYEAWLNQRKRCAYCFCELTEDAVTGDHVVPQSSGGTIDGNIVAACEDCNYAKQSMSRDMFKHVLGGRDPAIYINRRQHDLILLCRSKRRINLRADRACVRILQSVGVH